MAPEDASHVLVVSRDLEIRRRIAHALEADGMQRFRPEEVPDTPAAVERIREGGVDLALVRLQPPDGLDAVREIRSVASDVPVVVVLATGDRQAAEAAVRAGAVDSVAEEHLDAEVLCRTLGYALDRSRLEREAHRRTFVDDSTGLYNARGFERLASHHMALADRSGETVVLVFVRIQETAGPGAPGSAAGLAEDTASVLRGAVRDADVVGRLGPDTFAVLLSGDASGNEGLVLSRIVEAVATRNARNPETGTLMLAIGSAAYDPEHRLTLPELIRAADERLSVPGPPPR
jgi:diguanylate cyclase (GGDEF)-like protein